MKKRGDWLKKRREELKHIDKTRFSLRALAERVGISGAGMSHLENSDSMPSLDLAIKLARELDRSVSWILTGSECDTLPGIPIIGTTLTGPSRGWFENGYSAQDVVEYVDIPITDRRFYGLLVSNDISLTKYAEGEVIIADPDATPVTGEEVVVVTKSDNDSVIKILASQRDGKVFLDRLGDRQRMIRDLDDIIFIHPVVSVAKSMTIKAIK
ncbi:helix-turn-helix domain-containing protein [Pectobacterium brasiliense]|uniref:helix-turn-helix domain-containing protein n=1 Tax=Pectobacterium brasiliense TaxID=180957 RepID=UPI000B95CBCA|nr:helix-turn-helix transcriptional regulator [Pectobacterium carotovorum]OYN53225.1 hypothetical protein B7L51_01120 [Pectobacterium carotovorum]